MSGALFLPKASGLSMKKTDVVLIESAYYLRWKKTREQPQLGLAYIAAYLEKKGLKVKIIDAALDDLSPQQIAKRVKAFRPMAVGIYGCSDDRVGIIKTIEAIRHQCPEVLIVGGGPHFSYTAKDALLNIPALDVVVIGEGEFTMLELMRALSLPKKQVNFKKIKGLAYRQGGGEIVCTPPREPIGDLNVMPSPAWHLFEMKRYQGIMSARAPHRAIGLISSRGCPYTCAFCANALNKRIRYLKPSRFVDEIEHLRDRYGFEAFNFQDDSFTANRQQVENICQEIISRRMKIKWYCSLRVNRVGEDKDLLRLMKEAGCIALGFGIEFPSDDVLKKIKKSITVEMIEEALQNVAEVGFPYVEMFLMNSLPGQTRLNTVQAQLNINRFHQILDGQYPYKIFPGALTRLYPGTELTRLAQNQGNVFPPGFSWNRYYRNPLADDKEFRWLTNYWSMPSYEDENFPVAKIKRTLQETRSYFYLRRICEQWSPRALMALVVNPFKWKMLLEAFSIRKLLIKERRKIVADRWEIIEAYVKGKEVLDVGPAELVGTTEDKGKKERWLHGRMRKKAKRLIGLDLNQEQVKALRKKGHDIRLGDIEKVKLKERFDVVVAGELIEHLSNPGKALENIKRHLKKDGLLIITTPNRFDFLTFFKAFWANKIPHYSKEIAKHVFYFDENCLKALLSRHGYKTINWYYYWTFGRNYDSWLTKIILQPIIRFRPTFVRGLVLIAKAGA